MAMPPAATIAQTIVGHLALPPESQPAALAIWTIIVDDLRTMVMAATATVTGTATGAMGGGPGVPVVGTGTIA